MPDFNGFVVGAGVEEAAVAGEGYGGDRGPDVVQGCGGIGGFWEMVSIQDTELVLVHVPQHEIVRTGVLVIIGEARHRELVSLRVPNNVDNVARPGAESTVRTNLLDVNISKFYRLEMIRNRPFHAA